MQTSFNDITQIQHLHYSKTTFNIANLYCLELEFRISTLFRCGNFTKTSRQSAAMYPKPFDCPKAKENPPCFMNPITALEQDLTIVLGSGNQSFRICSV